MKIITFTLWLSLCTQFTKAQPPNNGIFTGGNGDGYTMFSYNPAIPVIYTGGSGDGESVAGYQQSISNLFGGGVGDGWASISFQQPVSAIFDGGDGDGWASVMSIRADNNVYRGGSGDGWSSTYKPMGPLPVTMKYFKATKQNEHTAFIEWETTREENVSHFEIERSDDAITYRKIGSTKSHGDRRGAQYNFTDTRVPDGTKYYRLKSLDRDGKFTYSPSRVLRFGNSSDQFAKFYPNPTKGLLNISIPSGLTGQPLVINISNSSGAVVDQKKITVSGAGATQINLAKLPKGIYLIHLKSRNVNTTQRIVLQ